MEPIDTDIVRILEETGCPARLQDHLTNGVFEALSPFLAKGYRTDVYSVPVEGTPLTVFVATKEGETPYAVATKTLRARATMNTSRMRGLIINAAKDILQARLRLKIFFQWMFSVTIVVLLLAMVLMPMILQAYGYSDQVMLLTILAAVVAVFVGCGAIPWIASQAFFERAWSRDPLAQLIESQLQTFSTD